MRSLKSRYACFVLVGIFFLAITVFSSIRFSPGPYVRVSSGGEEISFYPYTIWNGKFIGWSKGPVFLQKERETDPINIVLRGTDPKKIVAILQEHGWRQTQDSDQFMYVGRSRVKNAVQLEYRKESSRQRFHVRLFPYEKWVLGAVHFEEDRSDGGHRLISWEEAETFFLSMFPSFAHKETVIINEPNYRDRKSDGRAILIDLSGFLLEFAGDPKSPQ